MVTVGGRGLPRPRSDVSARRVVQMVIDRANLHQLKAQVADAAEAGMKRNLVRKPTDQSSDIAVLRKGFETIEGVRQRRAESAPDNNLVVEWTHG